MVFYWILWWISDGNGKENSGNGWLWHLSVIFFYGVERSEGSMMKKAIEPVGVFLLQSLAVEIFVLKHGVDQAVHFVPRCARFVLWIYFCNKKMSKRPVSIFNARRKSRTTRSGRAFTRHREQASCTASGVSMSFCIGEGPSGKKCFGKGARKMTEYLHSHTRNRKRCCSRLLFIVSGNESVPILHQLPRQS